ncbi:MAG TPA: DEAD/DEAH box helicase [Aestuariivirgaceae bacterium]|nr:DEAD/DEAH box helicase [Aestuariivirgaceae bacterium]
MPFPFAHPSLARALAERGYDDPTPVQTAVLEPHLAASDELVSAQTGSGKTVAYGLALATTLLGKSETFDRAGDPLALIVAPTRELALQVHRELTWLYEHTNARVVSCVGGMDARREQRNLAQGAHIVVGTPGRLRDHLERGNLDTSALRAVVLDEADEMLDLGFREDLEFLLDAAPPERRTLMFSATIPKDIANLAKRYQRNAVRVVTTADSEAHADIDYRAFAIAPNDVESAVVNVLRYFEMRGALVFCSTRESVRELSAKLLERGFAVVALSGELSQSERTHALQALRDGRAKVCVATDVAARGIDLPDLGLVIHADLPKRRETLLHRSGRTGRAGRKGICVLLVPHTRRRQVERLFQSASLEATWAPPPTIEDIRKRDRERLVQDPAWSEEPSKDMLVVARELLAEHGAEAIAALLVRRHWDALPAPEELLDGRGGGRTSPDRIDRDRGRPGEPAAPKPHHERLEDTVWFRMNIGRERNADPRWLVPLICRRGHVTNREIGSIRVFDRETKFEIARAAAERFATVIRRTDSEDEDIRIEAIRPEQPARKPAHKPSHKPGHKPGHKPTRRFNKPQAKRRA